MKAKGTRLELRVVDLFKRLGKWQVQRSVMVIDPHGNRSEIDVMYGFVFKTYVECKNYSSPVPLEDVAKFKAVLDLNGIPPSRGIFITSSTFVPRATRIGIKTVDGKALAQWEATATRTLWTKRLAYAWIFGSTAFLLYGPDGPTPDRIRDFVGIGRRSQS